MTSSWLSPVYCCCQLYLRHLIVSGPMVSSPATRSDTPKMPGRLRPVWRVLSGIPSHIRRRRVQDAPLYMWLADNNITELYQTANSRPLRADQFTQHCATTQSNIAAAAYNRRRQQRRHWKPRNQPGTPNRPPRSGPGRKPGHRIRPIMEYRWSHNHRLKSLEKKINYDPINEKNQLQ